MTIVKFLNTAVEDPNTERSFLGLFNSYSIGAPVVSTDSEVVFTDDAGHRLHFEGENLAFDGTKFTSGEVDKVFISNADDASFVTVSKFQLGANFLYKALTGEGNTTDMIVGKILKGNDTLHAPSQFSSTLEGGTGNDKLVGSDFATGFEAGKGNDILTCGSQADFIHFITGDGKDVIHDFDSKGEVHDFIYLDQHTNNNAFPKSVNHGHDTLFDFGGGDTILLISVKANTLDESDYGYF